jgi:NIPSNAP
MSHISRRSLLSWLGASAASVFGPLAAIAQATAQNRARILTVESFRATSADQMPRLHDYLAGALLPCMEQKHSGPKMFLEAIVAPYLPQALFLAAFASFDEMLAVRCRIAADPRIRRARAGVESAEVAVLAQVQSQVMLTAEECLTLPVGSASAESTVFELRSYDAPVWSDFPPASMGAALARAGVHPIVNAAIPAAEHLPRFTFLIPFESLAARHDAWVRLDANPEWLELQHQSMARHGSALKVTEKSIYKLAPYSPLA